MTYMSEALSQMAARAGDTGFTIFLSLPFIRPTADPLLPTLPALAVGTLYIFPVMAATSGYYAAFIAFFQINFYKTLPPFLYC